MRGEASAVFAAEGPVGAAICGFDMEICNCAQQCLGSYPRWRPIPALSILILSMVAANVSAALPPTLPWCGHRGCKNLTFWENPENPLVGVPLPSYL